MLLCRDEEELVSTESGGRSVEEMKNYLQDKIKMILDQKQVTEPGPESQSDCSVSLQHPRHSNTKYFHFYLFL